MKSVCVELLEYECEKPPIVRLHFSNNGTTNNETLDILSRYYPPEAVQILLKYPSRLYILVFRGRYYNVYGNCYERGEDDPPTIIMALLSLESYIPPTEVHFLRNPREVWEIWGLNKKTMIYEHAKRIRISGEDWEDS